MPSSARCCCLVLLAVMATVTTALQVTPDSPCASLCLDSSSRPSNSSSVAKIRDDEIVCSNRDYASEQGQKFQRCMNCLQNSTYSQGPQNDQAWFMYNLQYAYAHCVFGYPNGNGIGPYPCMTSEACGPLNVTVRRNLANNTGTDPFNYCSYRGGSSFGGTFSKCLDCMKADREHGYVANFFVALQAGCEQRPGSEGHLSLNGTLFDSRTISIVDPNKPSSSRKTGLSTGALVAVVIISVLLGLLLLGGGVFLHIRRRRRRLESDPHDGKSALEYAAARQQQNGRHGPSSMDFQCAENVSPFTPGSRDGGSVQAQQQQQQQQQQQHYHPQVRPTATAIYPDEKRNGTLEKKAYNDALRSHPPVGSVRNFSHKQHASVTDTETMPDDVAKPEQAAPTTTMPSSSSPSPSPSPPSPYSPDSYVTPSSATSATPFLAPGQTSVFPSTTTTSDTAHAGSSPTKQPSWDEPRQQGRGGGLLRSKVSKTDVTAPVAARQLQTTFPPPPKR